MLFFYCLDTENRARLMMHYWECFHKNLKVPDDPYRQPAIINAPEFEEDNIKELNKEMSRPSSRRLNE